MTSSTLRPSTPPCALTTFCQSLYPRCAAFPESEKSPESEREMPILIGPAEVRACAALPEATTAAATTTLVTSAAASRRAGVLVTTQPPSPAREWWLKVGYVVRRSDSGGLKQVSARDASNG